MSTRAPARSKITRAQPSPVFPAVRKPETKGERTRAALIEAGYHLFLRRGYHGTSMRDIARAAGEAVRQAAPVTLGNLVEFALGDIARRARQESTEDADHLDA